MRTALLFALALTACAEDLQLQQPEDTLTEPSRPDGSDSYSAQPRWFEVLDSSPENFTVQIDATDITVWRAVDLHGRRGIGVLGEIDDDRWHIAASRMNLAVNGGTSGPGEVEAVFVEGAGFESLDQAPAEGWLTDTVEVEEERSSEGYAMGDWYDYDPQTHVLTPRDGVFVVRTEAGDLVLQFLSYYDDAGNSGFLTVRWRSL